MPSIPRTIVLTLALSSRALAQQGLVAAFPCNEGSGSTVTDVTATHHAGTVSGATWTASGKYGAALSFDGSSDFVTVPDHTSLDLSTGATVMAWVYPYSLGGYRTVLMKERPSSASYYLYSGPGNLAMGGGSFGGSYREPSGGAEIPLNTWTHLAMTYDGATIRVFRNGSAVASLASTGPFDASNSPLRFGGNSVWGEWWDGKIDEVRIYNRALSAAEIAVDRDTPIVAGPTAPILMAVTPPAGAVVRSLSHIDVQFNEPVSGIDAADLLIAGQPATAVTSLPENGYRFSFPAAVAGPVAVGFASGHGIVDQESPPVPFAGGAWTLTVNPNAALEPVRINEVVTVNAPGGLADQDGDFEDWVELLNTGTEAVNLGGWSLTDDPSEPDRWIFPARNVPAGGYFLVFLSGKNRAPASGECHASFSLKRAGSRLFLFNADGPRTLVSAIDPVPRSQPGLSYGVNASGSMRHFAAPTPLAPNGGTEYNGIAASPVPTVPAGQYSTAFSLSATSTTPGATIRYTLDGSAPGAASPVLSAPLNIGQTTVFRAAAFVPGQAPSDVTTRTYLFVADVLTQSPNGEVPPGWPATWGGNRVDYGMDPEIVGPGAPYASRAAGAMLAIPTLSVVMDLDDLFDDATGIYANPGQNGDAWERPASLELLNADGSPGFQENGGLRIRGNFSRDTNNAKHSFRMFFRERYGAPKLEFPLFGVGAAKKHDVVDLRTSQDFSWAFLGSEEAVFVTDPFARDLMGAMGQGTTRGQFYHLYLNGQYWGLYNTEERVNPSFAEAYYGGSEKDYDVVKVDSFTTQVAAGNFTAWQQLWSQTEAGVASDAAYQALLGNNADGSRNAALPVLLDPVNLCDYMLMNFLIGNRDGPTFIDGGVANNFFAVRPHDGRFGWRFFAHDSEYSMFALTDDVTGPPTSVGATLSSSNARRMFEKCLANAEFRTLFADRVQKHCFGAGALSLSAQSAAWQARAQEIDQAVIGESARWGDSAQATPLNRDDHWRPRIDAFIAGWFPTRTSIVVSQLRARGYYPTLAAPMATPTAGSVAPGTVVTLGDPPAGAQIYFSLDGSDPRALGGAVSPAASVWAGPLTVLQSVRLRARVRQGTDWSPLLEADYLLSQDLTKLAVSEVMFAPLPSGAVDGAEFEFIELTNTGSVPLDLSLLTFTAGISGAFPAGTTLAPGGYVVAVRNADAFHDRYPGVPVALAFSGKLDNAGEKVALSDPAGGELWSLTYGVTPPWPSTARGLGFSMVNRNPPAFAAPDTGARWRASALPGGSPGAADPEPSTQAVVIGEIMAGTAGFIEIQNVGTSAVDLGGWFLADDPAIPNRFVFPSGSVVGAGQALAISATAAFPVPESGGLVFLFSTAGGNLTGYGHGWVVPPTDGEFSLGRVVDSTGSEHLIPLAGATRGATAALPKLEPVLINEIWYHPPSGHTEMVELRNVSGAAVDLTGWRLDGMGFTFPSGASISAGGLALVVSGDPNAFRVQHAVPATVPVFGPTAGALDDGGERLALQRPSTSLAGGWVALESAEYDDRAPWPVAADGAGPSLQRISAGVVGLEPTNWHAQGLTPGRPNAANVPPSVSLVSPGHLASFSAPASLTIVAAASDADGSVQAVEFFDGSLKLGEATVPPFTLTLPAAAVGDHWLTARARDDGFATTTSIPVLTTVLGTLPEALVPWSAVWSYRDNGSAPAATWKLASFDDSGWLSGPAELGYGDGDEATVVEDNPTPGYQSGVSNRYVTTWFRRRFSVAGAASLTGLRGRMIRDDGVAVYLNGSEIWRDNLAAGAGPTTLANSSISGTGESTPILKTFTAGALVEGENVLAVELHQQAVDSSDISFNFELTADRPAVAPDPDTDGDGMKDAWEMAHGLAYWDAADAGRDADADGTSNLLEYRLGLDPGDPRSHFVLTVDPVGTSDWRLTWTSAAGVAFAVEQAPNPAGPWQTAASVIGAGPTAEWVMPIPSAPRAFFRIRLAP